MIHIDRTKIRRPDWWDHDFQAFLRTWGRFHREEGGTRGSQRRLDAPGMLKHNRRLALPVLLEGVGHKCAYTEEPLPGEESAEVAFHRPEADAVGLESDVSPVHYWWLVGDWSNWYPVSRRVASLKGTSFPVVGPRADPPRFEEGSFPEPAAGEVDLGLLLDPGRDHPAWHLELREDGTVRAREHPSPGVRRRYGGHSRGQTTIRLLDLNSPELVAKRAEAAAGGGFSETLSAALQASDFASGELERFLPSAPFAGCLRQVLARRLLLHLLESHSRSETEAQDRSRPMIDFLAEELAAEIGCNGVPWRSSPVPLELWQPLRPVFEREWPELDDEGWAALLGGGERRPPEATRSLAPPPDDPGDLSFAAPFESHLENERVVERTARVERIEIRNFKAIEHLEIDLSTEPVSLPAPFDPRNAGPAEEISAIRWITFLGENGSGKSSCLQAVGLALAADRLDDLLATAHDLDWGRMLRRGTGEGRVHLRFTDASSLDLRFDRSRHWWLDDDGRELETPPRMAAYVRGYGATRLLDGGPIDGAGEHVRLANLFDPHAQVLDAEQWLLGLEEGDWNVAALTLSGFLEGDGASGPEQPEAGPLMTRGDGEVRVGAEPLSYLSDGYRAVITLVCDVMAGLGAGLSDLRNATGIVLIDELGSHLHPRWKMEITGRLRRELPNVQFFVSTHEPLCLRGMFGGEVIRVRKDVPPRVDGQPPKPGTVVLEVVERSPSDYRVDQLLTSEFFGLDTTIDPDLDRRFQAFYRLLAMTSEERAEKGLEEKLIELRSDIQKRTQPVLGFTRRDQLVYEAIDELLSREGEMSADERRAKRKATLERIQDIWRARGAVSGAGRPRRGGARRGERERPR